MKFSLIVRYALLLFLLIPCFGRGQNWVADSITIKLGQHPGDRIISPSIVDAFDARPVEEQNISIFEQKKALFFPVDQVVKTPNALAVELQNKFSPDSAVDTNYAITIHDFNIRTAKETGNRSFNLYSSIEVSKASPADTTFLGTFYYEQSYKQKAKVAIVDGYEILIDEWMRRFTSDVLAVGSGVYDELGQSLYHFRKGSRAINKNFYTGIEFFAGLNFWGIDGELWFSQPEGNSIFNRTTSIMRYINHQDFQSIAMGKNVRQWNYRISDKWLFTHKIAFLMGINNWKDMQTASHKLEEILLLNLSFTQRINYNRLDQQGLVFGVGLMEDAHYIIYHQPKLKIGLSLNCTYKF